MESSVHSRALQAQRQLFLELQRLAEVTIWQDQIQQGPIGVQTWWPLMQMSLGHSWTWSCLLCSW